MINVDVQAWVLDGLQTARCLICKIQCFIFAGFARFKTTFCSLLKHVSLEISITYTVNKTNNSVVT